MKAVNCPQPMSLPDRATMQNRQLKEAEGKIFQLADAAKRVDAKRRELLRQSEHQMEKIRALEEELDRREAAVTDLRQQVMLVGTTMAHGRKLQNKS